MVGGVMRVGAGCKRKRLPLHLGACKDASNMRVQEGCGDELVAARQGSMLQQPMRFSSRHREVLYDTTRSKSMLNLCKLSHCMLLCDYPQVSLLLLL